MNLFNKTFLTILSVTAICSSWATESDDDRRAYKRVITTVHDRLSSPFNPVDPNHQGMLALGKRPHDTYGIYTPADAAAIDADTIAEFYTLYGFDFGTATPDASGVRFLPGVGLMLPYIDGVEGDIVLVTDSENPNRARSGKWYNVQVGVAVLFLFDGTVPAGAVNAGATFKANDNWVKTFYNLVKKGANWHHSANREEFNSTSYELGKPVQSQWDKAQNVLSVNLVDSDGKVGTGVSGTVQVKRPLGSGPFYIRFADTFTWDWE